MDERYKKDKNKWIYWVISLRPCIVNILFPPDLIYKIKAMSIKNQAIFFVDIDMVILKYIGKAKEIAKIILNSCELISALEQNSHYLI